MLISRVAKPGNTVNIASRLLIIAAIVASMFVTSQIHAQGLISVGAGVGSGISDRRKAETGSGAHAAAYVQLHVPIIPVALRADALYTKTGIEGTALMIDAVYLAPIPVVSPYVMAGYGKYGLGKDITADGWNAGVGVRVRTPVVAFFVEAKRHQRIGRDLLTIGVSR
ncbi:MAG: hypothetical protein ABI852_13525 [Gemmatimonadaceae bacterium]